MRRGGRKLRAAGRSWKSLDPKPRAFHVQKSGSPAKEGKICVHQLKREGLTMPFPVFFNELNNE